MMEYENYSSKEAVRLRVSARRQVQLEKLYTLLHTKVEVMVSSKQFHRACPNTNTHRATQQRSLEDTEKRLATVAGSVRSRRNRRVDMRRRELADVMKSVRQDIDAMLGAEAAGAMLPPAAGAGSGAGAGAGAGVGASYEVPPSLGRSQPQDVDPEPVSWK